MRIFTPQVIANVCVIGFTSVALLVSCTSDVVVPDTPLPLAWLAPATDAISQPTVGNGLVYFIDEYGKLSALDVANGKQRWNTKLTVVQHSADSIGMDDGTLFVAQHGDVGKVLALDAQTGKQQWEVSFGPYRHGDHPIAHEGIVYFEATSPDGSTADLRAVDAVSGESLWELPIGSHVVNTPILGEDLIYLGAYVSDETATRPRILHAIDTTAHKIRWTAVPPLDPTGKLALDDERLYFGADAGVVFALDAATGDTVWTARVGGLLSNSPSVAEGQVYIGNKEGELIALNAEDGIQLWSLAVGSPILSLATMTDGIVYFGTNAGYLHAVDSQTGAELWKVQSPIREDVLIQDYVPAMSTTPVVADDLLLYFNGHTLNALKLK